MRGQHVEYPLILCRVVVFVIEVEAARTEDAARCVAHPDELIGTIVAGIDQGLGEHAKDAVARSDDRGDPIRMAPGGLDHATCRCIDDGRDSTGLGIQGVWGSHGLCPALK